MVNEMYCKLLIFEKGKRYIFKRDLYYKDAVARLGEEVRKCIWPNLCDGRFVEVDHGNINNFLTTGHIRAGMQSFNIVREWCEEFVEEEKETEEKETKVRNNEGGVE